MRGAAAKSYAEASKFSTNQIYDNSHVIYDTYSTIVIGHSSIAELLLERHKSLGQKNVQEKAFLYLTNLIKLYKNICIYDNILGIGLVCNSRRFTVEKLQDLIT